MTNPQHPIPARTVSLESFAGLDWDLATFSWQPEYNGESIGAIPVGSLAIWAGRPGVGKSTAGRGFAAQVSTGLLPGCWYGTPQNVAYLAAEENHRYSVVPSLIAAGADMSRIVRPKVHYPTPDGESELVPLLPEKDMKQLTQQFISQGVKVVIVDPLMEYMGGGDIDIYKNDQVRARVKPWSKLAEDIDGIVIAIMHLNKAGNGDVVAGINGSSAFGEVARSIFGFAKDPHSDTDDRIMSLEKNSLGTEGAAWTYRIESKEITNSKGKTGNFGVFSLVGDSSRTVGEVLRDAANDGHDGDRNEAESVVVEFLISQGGSAPANDVRKQIIAAGLTWKTVQNNRRKWGVNTTQREGGWVWTLEQAHPDATSRTRGGRDVGYEQVNTPKSHPEGGHIPHPTYIGAKGHDPDDQPSLPMKSA